MIPDMLDLARHRKTCTTCRNGAYCNQERTLCDLRDIEERKARGDWPWDDHGKFVGHGPDCERCNRT